MEMDQKQCWMWEKKKKNVTSSDRFPAITDHKRSPNEESWEEQAFAKDAGHLGGCVWPPRSYSCSFCKREFRSAQALGGHMNVHRRDRARLKHESLQAHIENPAKNNPFTPLSHLPPPSQLVCDLVCNPNPNPKSSSSWLSPLPTRDLMEESANGNDSMEMARNPIIFHKWFQNSDLSSMTTQLGGETFRSQQKPRTVNSIDAKEGAGFCKRKRTDAPSVAFFFRSEVLGLKPSSVVDDLDLELRLGGGRPKPKLK